MDKSALFAEMIREHCKRFVVSDRAKVAVSTERFADQAGSFVTGESSNVGGLFDLASGEAEILVAIGNTQAATIFLTGEGEFALFTDGPVALPIVVAATGPLVDVDTGRAVQQPMLIATEEIPVVEYGDVDQDARNRIDDVQIPPVRQIDNTGNNDFKTYGTHLHHKMPAGGDYQAIYVKDGDMNKRLAYNWKNKKLYHTPDHWQSWKEVNDPWKLGEPVFPPPI